MGDTIVVGTDGSDTAKQAVAEAVRLAKALDAEVHVVTAFEPTHRAKIVVAVVIAALIFFSRERRGIDMTQSAEEVGATG